MGVVLENWDDEFIIVGKKFSTLPLDNDILLMANNNNNGFLNILDRLAKMRKEYRLKINYKQK